MRMTLDEAIQHCREKEDCSLCGEDHRQLRLLLEDYKRLKEHIDQMPKRHGRLIDADRLIAVLKSAIPYEQRTATVFCMINNIENAPTVIEAEE